MVTINPEGLYYGNRMGRLSLMARLYWPYLYCLRNSFGRFEINYGKIVSKAFSNFPEYPTQEEFRSYIAEYQTAHLLFLYRSKGQVWGQWDTPERLLPKWKTAEDKASPAPPKEAHEKWLSEYAEEKANTEAVSSQDFENLQKNFENTSENFKSFGSGESRDVLGCVGLERVGVVARREPLPVEEKTAGVVICVSQEDPRPETENHEATNAEDEARFWRVPVPGSAQWPKTAEAMNSYFVSDDEIIERVVFAGLKVDPRATDAEIAGAVHTSYKRRARSQHGPALWITTVPAELRHARARDPCVAKPPTLNGPVIEYKPPNCEKCDDHGMISGTKWERRFKPCDCPAGLAMTPQQVNEYNEQRIPHR